MSMTEQGTQMAYQIGQPIAVNATRAGYKVTVRTIALTGTAVMAAMRFVATHLLGLQDPKKVGTGQPTTKPGKVNPKKLAPLVGGDVHAQEITPELKKYLTNELKAHGVTFATETAKDGKTYVLFSGRDLPTIEHGLSISAGRLEQKLATSKTASPEPSVESVAPTASIATPDRFKAGQQAATELKHLLTDPQELGKSAARELKAMLGTEPTPSTPAAAVTAPKPTPQKSPTNKPATKKDVVARIERRGNELASKQPKKPARTLGRNSR